MLQVTSQSSSSLLLNMIFSKVVYPEQWSHSVIVLLFKKGQRHSKQLQRDFITERGKQVLHNKIDWSWKSCWSPSQIQKGIFYHRLCIIYLISYHREVFKHKRREIGRSIHWPEENLWFCRLCILVPNTCTRWIVSPIFECHQSNVSVSHFLCTCT